MNKPTIADSAIYQQTAQLAEKYKAQRDEFAKAFKAACDFIDAHVCDPDIDSEMITTYAVFIDLREKMEQSL